MTMTLDLPGAEWPFSYRETSFMDEAACQSYDPRYWDTMTREGVTSRLGGVTVDGRRMPRFKQIAFARSVCASCPVKQQCLDFEAEHPSPEGIWGGLLPDERRIATQPASAGRSHPML